METTKRQPQSASSGSLLCGQIPATPLGSSRCSSGRNWVGVVSNSYCGTGHVLRFENVTLQLLTSFCFRPCHLLLTIIAILSVSMFSAEGEGSMGLGGLALSWSDTLTVAFTKGS